LATIRRDAPLTIGLDDLKYQGVQTEELIKFYQEMNFKSFLSKMNVAPSTEEATDVKKIAYTELTADNLDLLADLDHHVTFQLEMPNENYHLSTFAGFVIGDSQKWLVSRDESLL
ncbi:hypothetical protein, partial [Mordavella massiliensis]|uniref:hypothetical protein n=1 Tax=Mordavella massiliensis TaxID=1871024 RepID=UPI002109002E|nr:hypothetical protein [Mordavella massiliensis]